MKQQERQKELKSQYFFDCCCDACVNDQGGVVEQVRKKDRFDGDCFACGLMSSKWSRTRITVLGTCCVPTSISSYCSYCCSSFSSSSSSSPSCPSSIFLRLVLYSLAKTLGLTLLVIVLFKCLFNQCTSSSIPMSDNCTSWREVWK